MRFRKSLTSSASVSAVDDMTTKSNSHRIQAQHIVTRRQRRRRDRWRVRSRTTRELTYATDKHFPCSPVIGCSCYVHVLQLPCMRLSAGPDLSTYGQFMMCSNCPIETHFLGYHCTPFCSSIAFLCRYDTQNVTDALPCKLCRRIELGPHAFRILKNYGT